MQGTLAATSNYAMAFVDGVVEVRVSTTDPLFAQMLQGLNRPQADEESFALPGEDVFVCPPGGRLTTRPDGVQICAGG
jgi:hypothetical protein